MTARGLVRHQGDGPIGLQYRTSRHGLLRDHVPSLKVGIEPSLQLAREEPGRCEHGLGDRDVRVVQDAVAYVHGEDDRRGVVFPQRLVVVDVLEIRHALLRVWICDDVLLHDPLLPDVLEQLRDVNFHVEPRDVVYVSALLRPGEVHPVQHKRRDERPRQQREPEPNGVFVNDQRIGHRELHPAVPQDRPLTYGSVQGGEGKRTGDEHLHDVPGRGGIV
mmetsp:Transcript_5692/g.25298  ORF Transcript_5692/g.25298 Transcript_5692/m.25298 type:complete len:219 (+) Transcript_5692:1072-1728(+)